MVGGGPVIVFPALQFGFFHVHRHAKPFPGIYSLRSRAGVRRSCCPSQHWAWKFLPWNFNILTLEDRGVFSVLKPTDLLFFVPQNDEWHFLLAAGIRTLASQYLKEERECVVHLMIKSRVGRALGLTGLGSISLWFAWLCFLCIIFDLG